MLSHILTSVNYSVLTNVKVAPLYLTSLRQSGGHSHPTPTQLRRYSHFLVFGIVFVPLQTLESTTMIDCSSASGETIPPGSGPWTNGTTVVHSDRAFTLDVLTAKTNLPAAHPYIWSDSGGGESSTYQTSSTLKPRFWCSFAHFFNYITS